MDHGDHVRLIRRGIPAGAGQVWADFGSGWGAFTLALRDIAGPEVEIWSVDRSESSLRSQRAEMERGFPGTALHTIAADFTEPLVLPLLDGIVAANSIHYVRDQAALLSAWRDYLKPAGRIVLVEYELDRPNSWVPYPISFARLTTIAPLPAFPQWSGSIAIGPATDRISIRRCCAPSNRLTPSSLGGFGYQEAGLGDEAGYYLIGLGTDGDAGVFEGQPTDSLTGMRDLDLMRDSLGEKESVKLSAGDGPTLVMATKGTIVVDTESGQKTTLTKGHAAEFDGRITVKASADGGTDPNNPDTDGDGLNDGDELLTYGSSPLSTDSDIDLIPDVEEIFTYGTNPSLADTDHDDLDDIVELAQSTNPLVADTDGDGALDGAEITAGTNPLDPSSHP